MREREFFAFVFMHIHLLPLLQFDRYDNDMIDNDLCLFVHESCMGVLYIYHRFYDKDYLGGCACAHTPTAIKYLPRGNQEKRRHARRE